MSATKPSSARSCATRPLTTVGSCSVTRPQSRQIRWTCSGCSGGVVGRSAVAQVRVLDEPDLLEQLQRAVDRRDVHARRAFDDPGMDVLGRCVTEIGHRFEDELTLGGQPEAARSQLRLQLVHRSSLGRLNRPSAKPRRAPRSRPKVAGHGDFAIRHEDVATLMRTTSPSQKARVQARSRRVGVRG